MILNKEAYTSHPRWDSNSSVRVIQPIILTVANAVVEHTGDVKLPAAKSKTQTSDFLLACVITFLYNS